MADSWFRAVAQCGRLTNHNDDVVTGWLEDKFADFASAGRVVPGRPHPLEGAEPLVPHRRVYDKKAGRWVDVPDSNYVRHAYTTGGHGVTGSWHL